MAAPGLAIRADVASAPELRRRAKKEPRRRTAQRMLALANALDGMSRAEAARAAGIERQALRDAVLRFNAEGLAGWVDRPYGRRPERLTEGEQAVLVNRILRGPDPERGEPSSWTLRAGPCRTCAASSRSASARAWARNPCRGGCGASGCRSRKPGP